MVSTGGVHCSERNRVASYRLVAPLEDPPHELRHSTSAAGCRGGGAHPDHHGAARRSLQRHGGSRCTHSLARHATTSEGGPYGALTHGHALLRHGGSRCTHFFARHEITSEGGPYGAHAHDFTP